MPCVGPRERMRYLVQNRVRDLPALGGYGVPGAQCDDLFRLAAFSESRLGGAEPERPVLKAMAVHEASSFIRNLEQPRVGALAPGSGGDFEPAVWHIPALLSTAHPRAFPIEPFERSGSLRPIRHGEAHLVPDLEPRPREVEIGNDGPERGSVVVLDGLWVNAQTLPVLADNGRRRPVVPNDVSAFDAAIAAAPAYASVSVGGR